ncbi:MAG: amidohydrolase [Planctomycetota bacterium]
MSDVHLVIVLLAVLASSPYVFAVSDQPQRQPPAEVIYLNGNIYTMNAAQPRAEGLALAGGHIVAVGSNAEVLNQRQPQTKLIDLGGKTVLPGLIDAHCHVAGLGGYGLGRVDLSEAQSFDDVVAQIAARVEKAQAGEWILGGRWDHESWPQRRLPNHEQLSAVCPDNPVWLTRVDGHAGLANAAAMKLAGITSETTAPAGGEILHDVHGAPTGVFVDNACELIESKLGAAKADTATLVLKAQEMCLAVGLVGVHDAGIAPAEVDVYRQLAESGQLKLRVYAMVSARYAQAYFREHGLLIDARLTVRSAKLYADGALGSRGAWLLEPYADRPTDAHSRPYRGLNVMKPEFIRFIAEDGLRQGYQVCTHAIGDRANREVLDQYAVALSRRPAKDHRFRIEHAQILSLKDIPRFSKQGVIPSMQPTHCTSDMRWVEDRLGPRRVVGAYAWGQLRRTGVPLPGGSDFPVESHNPFLGLYAAVTRQDVEGQPAGGWRPQERMTRQEALRSFTLDAAYAAFEEELKGSLEPGKLADFIVIDRDVMTCEPREIIETQVLKTIVGGEVVYQAETQ